jgi:hypothetical protein
VTAELSEEQRSVVAKVEKLLRLADKNPNAAEAASATAKAQELLQAYNLSLAMVEQGSGGSGAREKAMLKGGVYQYQRDLWKAVAELNFCLHWNRRKWEPYQRTVKSWDGTKRQVTDEKRVWIHCLVGRTVNTASTRAMATYLEQAIERLLRERLGPNQTNMLFSRWAVSYREGAAHNIIQRIYKRRRELLKEEERKRRDAEAAAVAATRAGVSTATALTLSTYIDKETDANMDFIYGEGWSAEQAAERARRAKAEAEAEAEYAAWAAANPEEARREEEKARKREEAEEKRRARRGSGDSGKQYDAGAFWAGNDAAKKVSLDQQVDTGSAPRGRLSHG